MYMDPSTSKSHSQRSVLAFHLSQGTKFSDLTLSWRTKKSLNHNLFPHVMCMCSSEGHLRIRSNTDGGVIAGGRMIGGDEFAELPRFSPTDNADIQ